MNTADIILAAMSGIISGAFSVGGLLVTLRNTGKRADEAHHLASAAHERVDAHITDHARGQFSR